MMYEWIGMWLTNRVSAYLFLLLLVLMPEFFVAQCWEHSDRSVLVFAPSSKQEHCPFVFHTRWMA
jgi:hypothetical protein